MKSKGLEDHDKLSFQKELKEATPAYVVKVMDEFNRQQKARAKTRHGGNLQNTWQYLGEIPAHLIPMIEEKYPGFLKDKKICRKFFNENPWFRVPETT
jgi:hypothetical protein